MKHVSMHGHLQTWHTSILSNQAVENVWPGDECAHKLPGERNGSQDLQPLDVERVGKEFAW